MTTMINYGLQIAQGVAGFMIGSINAKLQATLQKYNNEILEVQRAMNANRITINEIDSVDASQRLKFAIQQQSVADQGTAEVMAAAAGVQGGSVDSTMRGLRRSAAFAQQGRAQQLSSDMRGHLEQRRGNNLSAIVAQDITVHKGPSILSAAAGIGMSLLDTYKDGQTDEQLAGPSSVKPLPSAQLGLGSSTADTLLADPSKYWKFHTGPNG